MMKKSYIYIALCIILLAPMSAQAAANQSVVYVDLAYILKNLPSYESAMEQLVLISRRWQKEIDAAQQEATVMATNFQTEQIFLTNDMVAKKEAAIADKENEVRELQHRYFGEGGELEKKREALIKPIQDEIYAAIQELANEKNIDIVKDRSADPSLLYMSSKLDVSDQILQKLGAK